ncbi:SARP family transcriptional regulator [Nocardiopsis kunsanensis]|uniref:SARP family transcriptional regulator n=1 Tax=Nocardiopsis kunsanensis TaxID=141693 RepID=A0A918X889_9ACTN|nr:BTAD domain-containing putative transcriptional regulator [Nocardiopsis kunsanensis]GHD17720.1 SARP family transcriptional regulator [Nocardiopsis kunsanensis]
MPETKIRTLLAVLLAERGRTVLTDRLTDLIWGDSPPRNPLTALQTKVWQLRRVLDAAEPGGRQLIATRNQGYALTADPETVDSDRFEALLSNALGTESPADRAASLGEALGLWHGPAFEGFSDPYFSAVASRLEERRITALEGLGEARLELGDHASVADELSAEMYRHPGRERLCSALMLALYRSGRQSEALAAFSRLRAHLVEELGTDPSGAVLKLYQDILRQEPRLEAPSPRTRPAVASPAPLTSLIGRDPAVARVQRMLTQDRLVTLHGPGGVGKTRLAMEVAVRSRGDFADGVHVVELAAHDHATGETPRERPSPPSVAEAVARKIGVRDDTNSADGGSPGPVERLCAILRDKRTLLVLDNCEHVIDQVAALAEHLLSSATGLRVLTTSRQPLGLLGEHMEAVPPLEVPPAAGGAGPDTLLETGSVQLFVERARAASPGFVLDGSNAGSVATLCRRLDGIPLALELAATRIRALGVHEVSNRLDQRFHLLNVGARRAPGRQQTLRSAIDWSWDLLSGAEAEVLRRSAVHVDGCTIEAAENTCFGGAVSSEEVLGLLSGLVDHALIIPVHGPDGPRYRLLESVSDYCWEKLRLAGEQDQLLRRHMEHYRGVAEQAETFLRGPQQHVWLERLDTESANLHRALESALRLGESESALRLVNALAWYWILRGRLAEGARALGEALCATGIGSFPSLVETARSWHRGISLMSGSPVPDEHGPPAADERIGDTGRARAEWFHGAALVNFGHPSEGQALMDAALERFRELDDPWGLAAVLWTQGWRSLEDGDLDALREDSSLSHTLFRDLGDDWGRMQAIGNLAELARINGDLEENAALLHEGLRIAEEFGLWTDVPSRLSKLGHVALLQGDLAHAEEFHRRALEIASEQSNLFWELSARKGLGECARRRGGLVEAEKHLGQALEGYRRIGYLLGEAQILIELGFVAEFEGDTDRAHAQHVLGLRTADEAGSPLTAALSLEGTAGAHASAGHSTEAARMLGAAEAVRELASLSRPGPQSVDGERIRTALRAAMGEEAFAAAHAEGRAHHRALPAGYLSCPRVPRRSRRS